MDSWVGRLLVSLGFGDVGIVMVLKKLPSAAKGWCIVYIQRLVY